MKELSIEQKAKRYDEAIARASEMIKDITNIGGVAKVDDIQYIFPELKESEDERIKHEIKVILANTDLSQFALDYTFADMIAWLEKQKPVGWSEEDSIICQEVIHVIDNCERFEQERNHENCVDFHHYQVLREWLKFLSNKYISPQPKQGEQKPANKVEPKFHEGDWVIYNNDICQIVKREEGCNKLVTNFGIEKELVNERNLSTTRLWSIQDAMDGDVLAYSDNRNNVYLCIYKEYKNERVYDYCTLNKESFWEHGNWNYLASFNYAPATKEQRNTLFKAMSDAGYTFDFVKKELKKMKQPNWSEEDEYYYGIVQYILNNERVGKADKENASNWFKSIKDRVQPQPKQEWNEEDIMCIDNLITIIENRGYPDYVSWLESLKDRYTWKPSEEQMKILNKVIFCTYNANNIEDRKHIESLYNDLKKLTE